MYQEIQCYIKPLLNYIVLAIYYKDARKIFLFLFVLLKNQIGYDSIHITVGRVQVRQA